MAYNKTKHLNAAQKYLQQGKMPQAILEYQQILKNEPKAPIGNKKTPVNLTSSHLNMSKLTSSDATSQILAKLKMGAGEKKGLNLRPLDQLTNGYQLPKINPGSYKSTENPGLPAFTLINPFQTFGSRMVPNEEVYYPQSEKDASNSERDDEGSSHSEI